jgi:hypothetical protein
MAWSPSPPPPFLIPVSTVAPPDPHLRRGIHYARRCPVPRPPSLPASHSQAPNPKARRPAGHLIFSDGGATRRWWGSHVPLTDLLKIFDHRLEPSTRSHPAVAPMLSCRLIAPPARRPMETQPSWSQQEAAVVPYEILTCRTTVKCCCRHCPDRCTSAHTVPLLPQSGQILVCFASAALPVLLIGNFLCLMSSDKSEFWRRE